MSLRRICELFVPEADDTDLLRACLWDAPAGSEAFHRWSLIPERAIAALQAGGGAKRRLLPLLHAKLKDAGVPTPPELRSILHAAYMYEELRTGAYRAIASTILAELGVARIPFLAMRGVYFAAKFYGPGVYRHCHDIDLLVAPESLEAAAAVLVDRCECSMAVNSDRSDGELVLCHTSGLPIALHTEAFRNRAYRLSWAELQERSTPLDAYGTRCNVLSSEDSLLQLIVHASMGANSRSLIWLSDAWHIVQQGDIDWQKLLLRAEGGAMTLPCLVAFEYLERELHAEVPGEFVNALRRSTSALSVAQRRHAEALMVLDLQAVSPGGRTQLLRHASGLRQRLHLLLVLLFPPAGTLQATGRVSSRAKALDYWYRRLWRGLMRRARRGLGKGAVGLAS